MKKARKDRKSEEFWLRKRGNEQWTSRFSLSFSRKKNFNNS